MKKLNGKVALVAGSARGAGRGIACMLGEAGATVYCTARSTRRKLVTERRPETIDETAELVNQRGGTGIAVRVDHTDPKQVAKLFDRIRREHGRLDILVNNVNGDALYHTKRSLEVSAEDGLAILKAAIHAHIINVQSALPLLKPGALIVEITDGDGFYYRGLLYYDLTKINAIRLAMDFAVELKKKKIAAVAVTPGFLRSEQVLESLRVSAENWRDAIKRRPEFAESETPYFVGRAIAALAADPNVMKRSGRVFNSLELAREYGFTDVDGRVPDIWTWLASSPYRYRKIDDPFYEYVKIDFEGASKEIEKIQREIRSARAKTARRASR